MLEHWLTMMLGSEQTIELMRKTGWNLKEVVRLLSPFNECPTPDNCLVMNIIAELQGRSKAQLPESCERIGPKS